MKAEQALLELANSRYDDVVVDIETAYDKDTAFEHPFHYRLLCVGLCYAPNKAIVISEASLADGRVRAALKTVLETKKIWAHNGKFDLQGLRAIAPNARLHGDTMLQSYVVDERPGTHGLKYLSREVLGAPEYDLETKKYKSMEFMPPEKLHEYNAYDVACTWGLKEYYDKRLDAEGKRLHDFLIEASNALIPTELEGMKVDQDYLEEQKVEHQAQIDALEKQLYRWVDNPRSVPQVSAALRALGVPYVSSTDRESLVRHQENTYGKPELREFATLMLEHRKLSKLYGTYLKGLEERLFDGRCYPTFLIHGTVTGRLACRNPNLFNQPRGSVIRSLFVAEEGNVFVQGDYNQLEARIVCTLAEEAQMAEIFRDPNRDIFWELAEFIFGASRNKHHRQIVKRVVHGSNYGMGPPKMSEQINDDASQFGVADRVSEQQAEKYQRDYFRMFPRIPHWQQQTWNEVFNEHKDITTPFGRHRRFMLITEENRKDIKNESLSIRPQSIASDICLTAFIRLREMGLATRLSVYDSVMIECPEADAEEISRVMQQVMEDAGKDYTEYVPMRVEIQTGKSWGVLA